MLAQISLMEKVHVAFSLIIAFMPRMWRVHG